MWGLQVWILHGSHTKRKLIWKFTFKWVFYFGCRTRPRRGQRITKKSYMDHIQKENSSESSLSSEFFLFIVHFSRILARTSIINHQSPITHSPPLRGSWGVFRVWWHSKECPVLVSLLRTVWIVQGASPHPRCSVPDQVPTVDQDMWANIHP